MPNPQGTMRRLLQLVILTFAAYLGMAIAPTSSHAATHLRWDRVAHCESTSRWHVNTGNGYYGGLQISRTTWKAYGGRRYASLPHRASKAQQIAVATRILRGQGRHAWPHCGRYL